MTLAAVAAGAALGAPLRFLVDRWLSARVDQVFPWGTFSVNVAGSLLLGALVGAGLGGAPYSLLATGLCGGLTTFSTFAYETLRLVEDGARWLAALNVAANVLASVAAAAVGWAVVAAWG